MPELPDIVVYIEALKERVLGEKVESIRVASPFVLRTYDPPYNAPAGSTVSDLHRVGKRIVVEFDPSLFMVIHLMIAGRLGWDPPGKASPRRLVSLPSTLPTVR